VAAGEPERRQRAVDATAHYGMVLARLGLRDEDVARRVGPIALARRVAMLALAVVVLAPFALAGLIANAIPTALVVAAGLVPRQPVTKGTVRVLVALVAFPVTWVLLAWFDAGRTAVTDATHGLTFPLSPVLAALGSGRGGVLSSLLVLVTLPLLGVATLAVVAEWGEFRVAWHSWRTRLDRRGQLDELRLLRAEVVAAMTAADAVAPAPSPTPAAAADPAVDPA